MWNAEDHLFYMFSLELLHCVLLYLLEYACDSHDFSLAHDASMAVLFFLGLARHIAEIAQLLIGKFPWALKTLRLRLRHAIVAISFKQVQEVIPSPAFRWLKLDP